MEFCGTCESRIIDFYHFVKLAEQTRTKQLELRKPSSVKLEDPHIADTAVYSTLQIVRNYISKHKICEIAEDESEQKLVITPKPKKPFQDLVSIKSEPVEIKIEPDDPELSFLHYIRSIGDSEELTNSSEGSSSSSLARLPAYEENTYFDGNKFVLRSEMPPKKLKEPKKRQRKPEMWATNIQKQLRNAGKRYRSTKGYIVEARSMAAPCNCRQFCSTKVNEKNRMMNFSSYWKLDDIRKKRSFIAAHIKLEPMRSLKKSGALSRLILHYLDVANSDGSTEQIKVCKTMFLNTLDISNTVLMTTVKAVKLGNQYFEK